MNTQEQTVAAAKKEGRLNFYVGRYGTEPLLDEFRKEFPDIKILVISSFQDDENVHAMLRNGADGYIDKGSLYHDLASNIRSVYHGKKVLSKEAYALQFR